MELIVTAIVAAIGAGAAKGVEFVGEHTLRDAYLGLKGLLHKKFGADSEVAKAVDAVEARPDSGGRKTTLTEELTAVKAAEDADLRAAAEALLAQLQTMPGGGPHIQQATGNYIAQADRGARASVQINRAGIPDPRGPHDEEPAYGP